MNSQIIIKELTIIGIDLSGPRNIADTSVAVFAQHDNRASFTQAIDGADDRGIIDLVSEFCGRGSVVVGIDAPLSYNPGGGDRPSDVEIRRVARERGRVGVMPPTLVRMVYLTLRGVVLSRALESLKPHADLRLVEVHPGASMLLRGAPAHDVSIFKHDVMARRQLLEWLEGSGLYSIPRQDEPSEHFVAACAAALAAWQWRVGKPAWCHPAQPPEHPYDFAC